MLEFKVYEKSEKGLILYTRSKMPALMTGRDMMLQVKYVKQSDGRILYIMQSVDREDLVPKKPKVIRMDFFKASIAEE